MTEPPSVSRVAVGGTIAHPVTGALATGIVRAAIPIALDVPVDGFVLGPGQAASFAIADGVFVGDLPSLPATDDPDVSQQDWLYEWSILTDVWTERFHAPLPSTPSTTTLARIHSSAVVVVPSPPGPVAYVPVTSVGQAGGPAGPLRDDSTLPPEQIPGGSGVTSLTAVDDTITIGGTGTELTIAVGTGIAQSAIAGLPTALAGKAAAVDLAAEITRAENAEASLASGTALTAEIDRATAAEATRLPLAAVTTKGDLVAGTAAATVVRVGVGTDGQVLTADSTAATGVGWKPPSGSGGGGTAPKRHTTGWLNTTFGPGGSGAGLTPSEQMPTDLQLIIPDGEVSPGDLIVWRMGIISTGNDAQCDIASIVAGEPVNFYSGEFTSDQNEVGAGDLYQTGDFGLVQPVIIDWVVQETDIAGDGTFRLSFLYVPSGGTRMWGLSSQLGRVDMLNFGH